MAVLIGLLAFVGCDPVYAQVVVNSDDYPHIATFVSDIDPENAIFEYEFSRAPGVESWTPIATGTPFVAHVCYEQAIDLPHPGGWVRQRVVDLGNPDPSEWSDPVPVPEPPLWAMQVVAIATVGVVVGWRRFSARSRTRREPCS